MKHKILLTAAMFCFFASYSQVNLTQGLMAYYPFSGNANDSSGNGNNPTYNNPNLTVDRFGEPNRAYRFNGVNNYIRIPNSAWLNMTNKISICLWVKVKGFYQGQCHGNRILMKGDSEFGAGTYAIDYSDYGYTNGNNCSITVPDTLHQNFYGVGINPAPSGYAPFVQSNKWYFLVYTVDGTYSRVYIDGILAKENLVTVTTLTNSSDLFLGRFNSTATPYWLNAELDDIRIYNRVINSSEINALYSPNVLPTQIENFSGEIVDNAFASLKINTLNEVNAATIGIERSYNNIDFTNIASLEAKNTPNNSYSFIDKSISLSQKKVYYRLKMMDKDGKSTYSSTLAFDINTKNTIDFSLFPNPAKSAVQVVVVSTKEENTQINVFDASGKTLLTQKVKVLNGTNNIALNNVAQLTKGIYLVQLAINQQLVTKKLIIH